MKKQNIQSFQKLIKDFYKINGRHDMLWRKTKNPYYILVSEMMLQQTQVNRVIEKYQEFIKNFPTTKDLAQAPLAKVLAVWSGLGYNRRAKFLKQAAEIIMQKYDGKFPKTVEALQTLPGVGHATASAILVYAYNQPIPYIETNVRSIFIHHFFPQTNIVSDDKIKPLIIQTLDKENPREWYWALMDYGTHLKKTVGNTSKKSASYTKQSKFIGSRRQKRSWIIKKLIHETTLTKKELEQKTNVPLQMLEELLSELEKEGLIVKKDEGYGLPR